MTSPSAEVPVSIGAAWNGWAEWACVAGGGALGALARAGCSALVGAALGADWTGTLAVNGIGAFALGLLLSRFEATGPRPRLRAFLAVGFLGAFTTFSSLVAQTPPAVFAMSELPAPIVVGLHLGLSIAVGSGAFLLGEIAASGWPRFARSQRAREDRSGA